MGFTPMTGAAERNAEIATQSRNAEARTACSEADRTDVTGFTPVTQRFNPNHPRLWTYRPCGPPCCSATLSVPSLLASTWSNAPRALALNSAKVSF